MNFFWLKAFLFFTNFLLLTYAVRLNWSILTTQLSTEQPMAWINPAYLPIQYARQISFFIASSLFLAPWIKLSSSNYTILPGPTPTHFQQYQAATNILCYRLASFCVSKIEQNTLPTLGEISRYPPWWLTMDSFKALFTNQHWRE